MAKREKKRTLKADFALDMKYAYRSPRGII